MCNDFALNNPILVSASPITTSDDDTLQTYLSFTLRSVSSLREFYKARFEFVDSRKSQIVVAILASCKFAFFSALIIPGRKLFAEMRYTFFY